ncbi:MAG: glutamyl-tRNA(Gln) amidotransferase subunit [Miltoncostaeaceae bacterium]|nr:glutamyl-tRNA(Gln) amidotransferase subunit [Miltoncostaeaceae bacterium]
MRLFVTIAGEEGRYVAAAPGLPGCAAVGQTRAQALAGLRRIVRQHGPWRDGASLFLHRVLDRHGLRGLVRSELVEVSLSSNSRIVQHNGGVLRCVRYQGLAGLFRKDDTMPWRFGRALCDRVRREFGSQGFFTTDELPGYGIGPAELAAIRSATGADPSDCVLLYAYSREQAIRIDDYIFATLREIAAPADAA